MTAYRRNFLQGGCFFFTVNLAERRLSLLTDHVEALRAAFRETRKRHPFTIDAIVILPDHLHTVWTLPEGDADFAMRWQLIKSSFSRGLARNEKIPKAARRKVNGAFGSADIGSIPFATTSISHGMSTMFTSIRSSTGSSTGCVTGCPRRFIATSGLAIIRSIGPAIGRMMAAITVSGDRAGWVSQGLNPSYEIVELRHRPAAVDFSPCEQSATGELHFPRVLAKR